MACGGRGPAGQPRGRAQALRRQGGGGSGSVPIILHWHLPCREGGSNTPLRNLPHACRFLQQNVLGSLGPGLAAALPQLDTLNISGNQLADLGGLEGCTQLRTLIAADNQLEMAAGLAALAACPALESVDLQNNKLEDGEGVMQVGACMRVSARMQVAVGRCFRCQLP